MAGFDILITALLLAAYCMLFYRAGVMLIAGLIVGNYRKAGAACFYSVTLSTVCLLLASQTRPQPGNLGTDLTLLGAAWCLVSALAGFSGIYAWARRTLKSPPNQRLQNKSPQPKTGKKHHAVDEDEAFNLALSSIFASAFLALVAGAVGYGLVLVAGMWLHVMQSVFVVVAAAFCAATIFLVFFCWCLLWLLSKMPM